MTEVIKSSTPEPMLPCSLEV